MSDDQKNQGKSSEPGFAPLLQGKDAWWHFLEAKDRGTLDSYDEGHDDEELELEDVGRLAQRNRLEARPSFQVAFTQSLRCDHCSAQIPADLTFCVHCGASPRFLAAMQWHLLVVDRIDEPRVLDELTVILEQANEHLSAKELRHALSQPPAVFYFYGRDEHASVFVTRLYELGIRAYTTPASRPDVPMAREVAESILRNPWAISVWVVSIVVWVIAALFINPVYALAGGILTLAVVLYGQSSQFRVRYELDVAHVLNALTGFDATMITQASQTLAKLEDDSVREILTVSLMEYYAIWRKLSAAPIAVRPVLSTVKANLDDLMIQILGSCARYSEIYEYAMRHSPEQLEVRMHKMQQAIQSATDRQQADHLQLQYQELGRQYEVSCQAQDVLEKFKFKLEAMWLSLESLRSRVSAMTMNHTIGSGTRGDHDAQVQQIMLDLDAELEACEDVFDVMVGVKG